MAEEAERSAQAVGAVNTLWLDGGRLCGANTDTYGFMTYLELSAAGWQRRDAPVSILGAGGAARAVAFGFLEAGVDEVRIFNRTRGRAEAVAKQLGGGIKVFDWGDRSVASRESSVLVNTTSVGLGGHGSLAMDFSAFADDCVVCDIVYVPLVTGLLGEARARGLHTVDGLGMLLHQAVPGFEKWFGVRPQVGEELYRRIAADIEADRC
jgi:shikimate dehydrogenase